MPLFRNNLTRKRRSRKKLFVTHKAKKITMAVAMGQTTKVYMN